MENKNDGLFDTMADMIKNPEDYNEVTKQIMMGTIEVIKDRLEVSDTTLFDLHITPEEHEKYFMDYLDRQGYDFVNDEIEQTYGGNDNYDRD